MIFTTTLSVATRGFTDIRDLTPQIRAALQESGLQNGSVTVFVAGSTAGITTIEFEPGLLQDLPAAFEKIAPMHAAYAHDNTWHDGNGYAHVRAALLGPSLVAPFSRGELLLGTWQQIVLVDFDNRPRHREIVAQFAGE
ncbi:MAG: secondary thiamine-phosphate synthase enzyme YjbQ [candidate division KSB1 bacterium]|nr:secondary thiamine-phosphate synthase enzyme YjbQ [candidate division KSB1 bacterium]MDZ7274684.1 secondary thiamine-phosphate synthase enzyme YjbQ [candidate division KSB1 bacterium]MDZ7285509.1 secondary thiamine-phosphate synthase enzyme YjbQ [candidate division KSB1 bacterium]MDZ7298541.1 secondary thiamine-phosphate synthase enzyme YjbQ [candidate division KSB1 bacterium]MDZ7306607.1 secondary thiamine-phosphate synthase enzyme YjbQ [candidate division KSB1 bacterium]